MICLINFKSKVPIIDQLNLMNEINENDINCDLLIAPSLLENNDNYKFEIISQNSSISKRTVGEISPNALHYLNINYSLIGHLERRKQLNESYELINDRLKNAIDNSITPIICLGFGRTAKKSIEEFNSITDGINLDNHKIIVAWESLKSTENGVRTYTDEYVENIFKSLKNRLNEYNDLDYKLLLGGHVGLEEAKLAKKIDIDGVLIGDRYKKFEELSGIFETLS